MQDGSDYFKWVFDNAPIAIAVLNPEDIWLDANPAMCAMLRMKKEDLIGTNYQAWIPDDALEERDRARAEFERTGMFRGKSILYHSAEDRVQLDVHAAILEGGLRLVMASDISDREQARAELAKTKERLELALSAGEVATWIWDVVNGRIYGDENLKLFYNVGPEDINGGTPEKYIASFHPEDSERVQEVMAKALSTAAETYEAEFRLIGSDGRTRWVLGRGLIERDEKGAPVRVPGVLLNITKRKQAEEALRESQHRFQTLFSVIDEGYCLCDTILNEEGRPVDYRFLEVNPLFEQLTGLKDAVGKTAYTMLPELEPIWAEVYGEVALGNTPKRFQLGSDVMGRFFDVFATPMQPRGRFALVFKDITSAKAKADALRSSEERKAAILGSAIDCIITMDHEGKVVEFNPSAERTFGHKAADVIGRTVAEVIIPERLRKAHWAGMKRYLDTGEQRVLGQLIELPALRADGSEFPAELSINVVRSEGEEPFFTAFLRDITQRKEVEAAMKDADRKKDEFIATMAHELRNPLAPIRTALDVLQSEGVPQNTNKEMLKLMDRQLSHMVHLIEDLLDVSRISQGKIELRRQLIDLSSVIHEAVEANKPYCDASQIPIEMDLPEQSFLLYADRTRLIQVIGNLLHNACKFSDRGRPIRIQLKKLDGMAEIRVRDKGIGIAADRLPDIFKMFSQVEAPLDRSHGGLGIGLSLVKSMVELHGGSVDATSEGLGKGSEFVIRIPLMGGQEKDAIQHNGATSRSSHQRSILIADDHLDTIHSLSAFLTVNGHEVHIAHDGLQALELARKVKPQVVILDIGMPRMNGYEAAAAIRNEFGPAGPFLAALTGWGQLHDKERSREAGFDHHMVKPVEPSKLLQWLDALPVKARV
jgi:PAS domain S-box-containing protein